MTPKGAQYIIESLSLRIFAIEEAKDKLDQEAAQLRSRIQELENIRDSIVPDSVVMV